VHEYSIIAALLERVRAEAAAHGASAVTRLWVQVGELSGVECELLRTAYETFRERTICKDAPLELSRIPARWACTRCDREIASGDALTCPECGRPATLCGGDELMLQRIEMEVA